MPLNNLSLSVSGPDRPTDPLEIFRKLTLRGSIENIWDPQAEALREWDKIRGTNDAVIQMNTGGGKTLVGLLMAKSMLHELNCLLYTSPSPRDQRGSRMPSSA